jgi:hypothetical protein
MVNWRLWLGGAALLALILLGAGRGLRLPVLAMGGKGLVITLLCVLIIHTLWRSGGRDVSR